MPMIGQNDNLGGIVLTATKVNLILSLAIIAIPTVAPAQSTASQPPGPEPLPPMPADANPSFDVDAIKPSDTSAPHGTFFRTNGRHVIAYNIHRLCLWPPREADRRRSVISPCHAFRYRRFARYRRPSQPQAVPVHVSETVLLSFQASVSQRIPRTPDRQGGPKLALTFGATLTQDWESAGLQLIYATVYASLLAFRHHNAFSADELLQRNPSKAVRP
jgi:hypothetical protein